MTSEHTDFTLTWQRIGCRLMKGPRERADRVAEVSIGYKTSAELEAIGSRMAATWNACAGIETGALENGAVRGFADAAGEWAELANEMEARADEAERLLREAADECDEYATVSKPPVAGRVRGLANRIRNHLAKHGGKS